MGQNARVTYDGSEGDFLKKAFAQYGISDRVCSFNKNYDKK